MSLEQVQLMGYLNFPGRVQRLYLPDKFTTVAATAAGATDVWVSANNFLLLGFTITAAGSLAAAGEQTISLVDTAASGFPVAPVTIWEGSCWLPATGSETGYAFFGQDYGGGYGYLSLPANTTMTVKLGSAMASGHVYVNVWGSWNVFPSP